MIKVETFHIKKWHFYEIISSVRKVYHRNVQILIFFINILRSLNGLKGKLVRVQYLLSWNSTKPSPLSMRMTEVKYIPRKKYLLKKKRPVNWLASIYSTLVMLIPFHIFLPIFAQYHANSCTKYTNTDQVSSLLKCTKLILLKLIK